MAIAGTTAISEIAVLACENSFDGSNWIELCQRSSAVHSYRYTRTKAVEVGGKVVCDSRRGGCDFTDDTGGHCVFLLKILVHFIFKKKNYRTNRGD